MKKSMMVCLLCALVGVVGWSYVTQVEAGKTQAAPAKEVKKSVAKVVAKTTANADVQEVAVKIGGMSCGGCVNRITGLLKGVKGVVKAKVTLQPQRAVISYNVKQVKVAQLVKAIKKAGYSAGVEKLAAATGTKKACSADCNCAKCKAKKKTKKKTKKGCKAGCKCASCKSKKVKTTKS